MHSSKSIFFPQNKMQVPKPLQIYAEKILVMSSVLDVAQKLHIQGKTEGIVTSQRGLDHMASGASESVPDCRGATASCL